GGHLGRLARRSLRRAAGRLGPPPAHREVHARQVASRRQTMGIKGIDHWVIVAGDLQRTLSFYEALGFKIAWEKRPNRPDMATIRIRDSQKINMDGPDAPSRPGYLRPRRPSARRAHFCP